jgi:hypothetical protein
VTSVVEASEQIVQELGDDITVPEAALHRAALLLQGEDIVYCGATSGSRAADGGQLAVLTATRVILATYGPAEAPAPTTAETWSRRLLEGLEALGLESAWSLPPDELMAQGSAVRLTYRNGRELVLPFGGDEGAALKTDRERVWELLPDLVGDLDPA